jgi:hypothetical protein
VAFAVEAFHAPSSEVPFSGPADLVPVASPLCRGA